MSGHRTITYTCFNCGKKNSIEIPKPRFGGRGIQVQEKNMPAEPHIYQVKCGKCGLLNSISLK